MFTFDHTVASERLVSAAEFEALVGEEAEYDSYFIYEVWENGYIYIAPLENGQLTTIIDRDWITFDVSQKLEILQQVYAYVSEL